MRIAPETAESMYPWKLAESLGIQYSGDISPFDHGGFFFSSDDWRKYGFASGVRFWQCEGRTIVEQITINRPDSVGEALKSIGIQHDDLDEKTLIHAEIVAVEAYCGADVCEDFSGRYAESYEDDQESECWRLAIRWIAGLAE